MAKWTGKVGLELQLLADYVLEEVKQSEGIFPYGATIRMRAARQSR